MKPVFPPKVPLPWLKPGVFAGAFVPLVVILWRAINGQLGADIVASVLNQFGYLAIIFLTMSLLSTPLKIITGWTWGIRIRRMLGLYAFFYASLHFLTYLIVDQSFNIGTVLEDITKRKFILLGFLALMPMAPLAITSTQKMVKRMGYKNWKRLHRLAYFAGGLAAVHFILRVKADYREPFVFVSIVVFALTLRVIDSLRKRSKKIIPNKTL